MKNINLDIIYLDLNNFSYTIDYLFEHIIEINDEDKIKIFKNIDESVTKYRKLMMELSTNEFEKNKNNKIDNNKLSDKFGEYGC